MPKNNLKLKRQQNVQALIAAKRVAQQLATFTGTPADHKLENDDLVPLIKDFAEKFSAQTEEQAAQLTEKLSDVVVNGIATLDLQSARYQEVKKAYDDLQKLKDKQKELNEKRIKLWTDAGLPALAVPAGQPSLGPEVSLPNPPDEVKDAQKAALAEIEKIEEQLFGLNKDGDPILDQNGESILGLNEQIQQQATALNKKWSTEYFQAQEILNTKCQELRDALNLDSLKAMQSYLPQMAARIREAENADSNFNITDDKGVTKSKAALEKEFSSLVDKHLLAQNNLKFEQQKDQDGNKLPGDNQVLTMDNRDGAAPSAEAIVKIAILKGWDPVVTVQAVKGLQGETGAAGLLRSLFDRLFYSAPKNHAEEIVREFNKRGIAVEVKGGELSPFQKAVNDTITKLAAGDPKAVPPVLATPRGQAVHFAEIYAALLADDTQKGTNNAAQYLNSLDAKAVRQILEAKELPVQDVQMLLRQMTPDVLQRHFTQLKPAIAQRMQDIPLDSPLWAKLANAGVIGKGPVPAVARAQKAWEEAHEAERAIVTAANPAPAVQQGANAAAQNPVPPRPDDAAVVAAQEKTRAANLVLISAQKTAEEIGSLKKYVDSYAKEYTHADKAIQTSKRAQASNLSDMLNVYRRMTTKQQGQVQFSPEAVQLMREAYDWHLGQLAAQAAQQARNQQPDAGANVPLLQNAAPQPAAGGVDERINQFITGEAAKVAARPAQAAVHPVANQPAANPAVNQPVAADPQPQAAQIPVQPGAVRDNKHGPAGVNAGAQQPVVGANVNAGAQPAAPNNAGAVNNAQGQQAPAAPGQQNNQQAVPVQLWMLEHRKQQHEQAKAAEAASKASIVRPGRGGDDD